MVRLLHEAGSRSILDVVYNHTCEQGADGATLSLRGLDNRAYYRLDWQGRDVDVTGCGNTVDLRHPVPLRLVLDSLRHWVQDLHVDGFRFDLATALARGRDDAYDPDHPFLMALRTDPVLSRVKLIAEPWDVGQHGWRTGQFPPPFAEWNDRYRDCVETFWLADGARQAAGQTGHGVRELATRLAGSQDLFGTRDRGPLASVNYLAAHDGFTLADTTAYDRKHNEANGEHNRDGHDDNRSWNHGVEGPTDDSASSRPRHRSTAQPARHPAAVDRRADDLRRRRDGPHPARQQQRLLPGQRDLLARLGPRALAGRSCWRTTQAPARPAPRARRAAPAAVLRRPPAALGRHRPTSPGSAPTAGGWTRAAGTTPAGAGRSQMALDGNGSGLDGDSLLVRRARRPRDRRCTLPGEPLVAPTYDCSGTAPQRPSPDPIGGTMRPSRYEPHPARHSRSTARGAQRRGSTPCAGRGVAARRSRVRRSPPAELGAAGHASRCRGQDPHRVAERAGAPRADVALEAVPPALVGLGVRAATTAVASGRSRRTRRPGRARPGPSTSSGSSPPRLTKARTCRTSPTCGESPTPEDSTWSTRTGGQAARTSDFQAASSRAPAYLGRRAPAPAAAAGA